MGDRENSSTTVMASTERGGSAPGQWEGLFGAVMPGLAYAVVFALGAGVLELVIGMTAGSYLAWPVAGAAVFVWVLAAAAAWAAGTVVLMPAIVAIKGRWRGALVPGFVFAVGFVACSINMKANFAGVQGPGARAILDTRFLAIWGAVVGAVAAWVIARTPREGPRAAALMIIIGVLASNGAAYYLPNIATYALVGGPVALAVIAGAVAKAMARRPRVGRLVAFVAIGAACVLAIAVTANAKWALGPIDKHFKADPGLTAMLAGKPNVIVITLDTFRADHLSLLGYEYATTPNLERIAKECQFYPQGETVDSWTLPAHASLFTGKYPREHGARGDMMTRSTLMGRGVFGTPLARSQPTMAAHLARRGYNTAAFVANYSLLCRQTGLDQGFAYYYDIPRFTWCTPGTRRSSLTGRISRTGRMGAQGRFRAELLGRASA